MPTQLSTHALSLLLQKQNNTVEIQHALEVASDMRGLSLQHAAALLQASHESARDQIYDLARSVRWALTGNKVFLHQPVRWPATNTFSAYSHSHNTSDDAIASMAQVVTSLSAAGIPIITLQLPPDASVRSEHILKLKELMLGLQPASQMPLLRIESPPLPPSDIRMLVAAHHTRIIHIQPSYDKAAFYSANSQYSTTHNNFETFLQNPREIVRAGADRITLGICLQSQNPELELLCLLAHNQQIREEFGHGARVIHIEASLRHDCRPDNDTLCHFTAALTLAAPDSIISIAFSEAEGGTPEAVNYGATFIGLPAYDHAKATSQTSMDDALSEIQKNMDTTIRRLLRDYAVVPALCIQCYQQQPHEANPRYQMDEGIMHAECASNNLKQLAIYLRNHGSAATRDVARKALVREFANLDGNQQAALHPILSTLLPFPV